MLYLAILSLVLQSSPAAPPAADVRQTALARVESEHKSGVEAAFAKAGPNAEQLAKAIIEIAPEMRPGMVFLVETMPERDLTTLQSKFLLDNVRLAYEAWRGAPWGSAISTQTFFQYVLPYVNINERRDDWRGDFVKRFQAESWKFPERTAAVKWINDHLNDAVNVHYHASKRKKPDQSPYESMELNFASCTGLSILLVDACRACGIPARCVGCPAWKKIEGNHTWVEVFADDGTLGERWFNVGDTGSDPRGENWVNERCRAETDPTDWAHAVYAAAWRPTGRHFPLPWEWEIQYVPALNVTRFYSSPVESTITLAKPGPGTVEAHWKGELIARRKVGAGATTALLHLAYDERFDIVIRYDDGTREDQVLSPSAAAK
ncbi:MAG: transglutaminase-like domain-containing protein [Phycisphaerae bacterium]|nr:transglutaminase-like domain-containing protein [Phycisphaerae bacterium]